MDRIWLASSLSAYMTPFSGPGQLPLLIASNHRCDTLVSRSAIIRVDRTNVTSTVGRYSTTGSLRVVSCLLMSISFAAFVCTRALLVRVSDTQWYTLTESVLTCSTLLCHWIAELTPFNTASSSTRLICLSIPQATRSQPHTRRCPTNLPHKYNTVCRVTNSIIFVLETTLPRLHHNSPCSIATTSLSTRVI